MKEQIIMRPVYNRPEMLKLSLEYEIKARKYHKMEDRFTTLFIIEYGSPKETIDLVKNYPYQSFNIYRKRRFGLTINILEGMKDAFNMTGDYVIYIEDDILIHETYFKYIDLLLNMPEIGKWSILSPFNFDDGGDVHEVRKMHHYAALAPVINFEFYEKHIYPSSNEYYYGNPVNFVLQLNGRYEEHWKSRRYKYTNAEHHEQAGLINRLVDAAMIDDGMHVIMPRINRQQHIGYFGKNRPGGHIPGKSFDERVKNLREIIKSADKMYELSATKQYNDYKIFSPKLDEWDGTLRLA
jgi:hypothetical protein